MVVKVDDLEINSDISTSEVAKDSTIMLVDKFGVILASNEKDRKIKSLGTLSPQNKKNIEESDKFLGKEIVKLQYDVVATRIR